MEALLIKVLDIVLTALMGYVVYLLKKQKKDRDANSSFIPLDKGTDSGSSSYSGMGTAGFYQWLRCRR